MVQRKVTNDDIEKTIQDKISGADVYRGGQLKTLAAVKKIKARNLEVEKHRLTRRFGESHERVTAINDRITRTHRVVENLEHEVKRDEETAPEVDKNTWIVKGRITQQEGAALAGVIVSLYDKDLFFDDYLGTRVTDENGNFEFIYRGEGFQGLLDANPDIYLKVFDKSGKQIYSSRKKVTCEAGRQEVLNIKIKTL